MSKVAGKQLKGMRKVVQTVVHCKIMRTDIPAGMASVGPPLGPTLGQRGLNVAAFCKEFNERTADLRVGIPLPARITVNDDRTYDLVIHKPPGPFFIKQAAGIPKGAMHPAKEVAGKITLKHVYEIAKIKQTDPPLRFQPLERICRMIIGTARVCGVEVVRDLDPKEYGEFLEARKVIIEQQQKELQEAREAKLLRATAV